MNFSIPKKAALLGTLGVEASSAEGNLESSSKVGREHKKWIGLFVATLSPCTVRPADTLAAAMVGRFGVGWEGAGSAVPGSVRERQVRCGCSAAQSHVQTGAVELTVEAWLKFRRLLLMLPLVDIACILLFVCEQGHTDSPQYFFLERPWKTLGGNRLINSIGRNVSGRLHLPLS